MDDYRCEFCGKITRSPAGLKRHITIKHRQSVVIDLENRLVVMEEAIQALRNSVLELINTLSKTHDRIWKAINAIKESSFKRDNDILDLLKVISRDSSKHKHDLDIQEIIDGLRAYNQSNKVKGKVKV